MPDSLHVVCSHCHSVNRVPRERLGAGGKCGRCKHPLLDGHPVELTMETFNRHIGRSDLPIVVDFWAPWCGPCKMMAPVFIQAAAKLRPHVILAKVNTEQEQALAAQYGIRSIPTLALFRGGKEIDRIAGAMDLNNLLAWVRRHL